jgi:hypothetical protein
VIKVLATQHQVTKHAGDSLSAFGKFNYQFAFCLNAFGTDDNLLEDRFVIRVITFPLERKLFEQKVMCSLSLLPLGGQLLGHREVLSGENDDAKKQQLKRHLAN